MLTGESLGEEVDSQWVGVREQRLERPLLAERHGTDVVLGPSRRDGVELFNGRGAKDIEDEGQLVVADLLSARA